MPNQTPQRWLPMAALVTAVLASVAIVVLPLAQGAKVAITKPTAPSTLPPEMITTVPGTLADGSALGLRYVLGPRSSVGTSMTADGRSYRLIQVVDGGMGAELRRLPTASGPQYDGFTLADGQLYWVETMVASDGVSRSTLWTAPISPDATTVSSPRVVLEDMGPVIFYDSAHDLIVADGRITWVVVGSPTRPGTILRSVPVGGGPVTDRGFAGPWRQIDRPWLLSAAIGTNAMLNVDTGQVVTVPATASDMVACNPQSCHFTVKGPDGPVRLGVMKPDGSQQTRVAGPGSRFETYDAALLGRYELFSDTTGLSDGDRRLQIYDLQTATTRLVEIGPGGLAMARDTYVWWISGDIRSPSWHVLDLRQIA